MCLVRNPIFTNTRFNEQANPLELTFTNPTGGAGFGTLWPFVLNLDMTLRINVVQGVYAIAPVESKMMVIWTNMANKSAVGFLLMTACLLTTLPGHAQETGKDVQIEWLTWSFFRITSPEGKVILTNPWITNPDSKITLEQVNQADIILVPTGHRDEVGETVEIANKT